MNLKLNMKDINKILAKAHFKCKKKIDEKKQHIFAETCLYGSVGSLPVIVKSSENLVDFNITEMLL